MHHAGYWMLGASTEGGTLRAEDWEPEFICWMLASCLPPFAKMGIVYP
jgi:hypothetical protein